MFGWRKKKDGFVWNEYIRTTVLLRREQRRQKVEDVRDAAIDGIKNAGRHGVALSIAGASAAGRGVGSGLSLAIAAVYDWVSVATRASWLWICDRSGPFGFAVASGFRRTVEAVSAPQLAMPLLVVGAICGASAGTRWGEHGFDRHTVVIGSLGIVALLLGSLSKFGPFRIGERFGPTLARLQYAPSAGSLLRIGGGLAVALGVIGWLVPALMSTTVGGMVGVTGTSNRVAASGQIEGRATAISGELLKVDNDLVLLSGIEAPVIGQTCAGAKSCASAGKVALQKLIGGKRVTCETSARLADGSSVASCQVNGADIAGQLVRGGHVFAATGLFATYASAEREAKSAKVGVWRNDVLRPEDYRAKLWADAKSVAPDGCPIKGLIAGDAKTYVLPGAAAYDKAKVRAERGERWFCSEAEAVAAGWTIRLNG